MRFDALALQIYEKKKFFLNFGPWSPKAPGPGPKLLNYQIYFENFLMLGLHT